MEAHKFLYEHEMCTDMYENSQFFTIYVNLLFFRKLLFSCFWTDKLQNKLQKKF